MPQSSWAFLSIPASLCYSPLDLLNASNSVCRGCSKETEMAAPFAEKESFFLNCQGCLLGKKEVRLGKGRVASETGELCIGEEVRRARTLASVYFERCNR